MCVLKRVWQRACASWLEGILQVALILLISAAVIALGTGICYGAIWILESLFGEATTAIIKRALFLGGLVGLVIAAIVRGIRGIVRAIKDCRPGSRSWEDSFGC